MRKILVVLFAVVICPGSVAQAQCSLFGHSPQSVTQLLFTPTSFSPSYMESGTSSFSLGLDWNRLLCQTLCGQSGGNGGGSAAPDLSDLEDTMDRIESKMTKLETLMSQRVKKNSDDIAQLVERQQQLANLTDARIMKLAELIEQNAILAGNTQDRLDKDVDNLTTTIKAIGKLQNLVSGERYMVKDGQGKIFQFQDFDPNGNPKGGTGKAIDQGTIVYGIKQFGRDPNQLLIRWNKGDSEEPEWVEGYIHKDRLEPKQKTESTDGGGP